MIRYLFILMFAGARLSSFGVSIPIISSSGAVVDGHESPKGKMVELMHPAQYAGQYCFIQTSKGWGLYDRNFSNWVLNPEFDFLEQLDEWIVVVKNAKVRIFHLRTRTYLNEYDAGFSAILTAFDGDKSWYVQEGQKWKSLIWIEGKPSIPKDQEGYFDKKAFTTHSVKIEEGKVLVEVRTRFPKPTFPLVNIDALGTAYDSLDKNGNLVYPPHSPDLIGVSIYDLKSKKSILRSTDYYKANFLNGRYILVKENLKQTPTLAYALADSKGNFLFRDLPLRELVKDPARYPPLFGFTKGTSFNGDMVNERFGFYSKEQLLNITTINGAGIFDLERGRWNIPLGGEAVFAPWMQDFYIIYGDGTFYFQHPDSLTPSFSLSGDEMSYDFGKTDIMAPLFGVVRSGEKLAVHQLVNTEAGAKERFHELVPGTRVSIRRKYFHCDIEVRDSLVLFSVFAPQLRSMEFFYSDEIVGDRPPVPIEQYAFNRAAIFDRVNKQWLVVTDSCNRIVPIGKNYIFFTNKGSYSFLVKDPIPAVAPVTKPFIATTADFSALLGKTVQEVRLVTLPIEYVPDTIEQDLRIVRLNGKEGVFDLVKLKWLLGPEYDRIESMQYTPHFLLYKGGRLQLADRSGKLLSELSGTSVEMYVDQNAYRIDDRIVYFYLPNSSVTVHDQLMIEYSNFPAPFVFRADVRNEQIYIQEFFRTKGEIFDFDVDGNEIVKEVSFDTAYNKTWSRVIDKSGKVKLTKRYFEFIPLGSSFLLAKGLENNYLLNSQSTEIKSWPSSDAVIASGKYLLVNENAKKVTAEFGIDYSEGDYSDSYFFMSVYSIYLEGTKVLIPDSLSVLSWIGGDKFLVLSKDRNSTYAILDLSVSANQKLIALPENYTDLFAFENGNYGYGEIKDNQYVYSIFNGTSNARVAGRTTGQVTVYEADEFQSGFLLLFDSDSLHVLSGKGDFLAHYGIQGIEEPHSIIGGRIHRFTTTTGTFFLVGGNKIVSASDYLIWPPNVTTGRILLVNRLPTAVAIHSISGTTLANVSCLFKGSEISGDGTQNVLEFQCKESAASIFYTNMQTNSWTMVAGAPVLNHYKFVLQNDYALYEYTVHLFMTANNDLVLVDDRYKEIRRWKGVKSIKQILPDQHPEIIELEYVDSRIPKERINLFVLYPAKKQLKKKK